MMTLALRLGKTLAELEQTMTARELYLWMAYDRKSPISDKRHDILAAQISTSVWQSHGAKVSISDMLINWDGSGDDGMDDEEIMAFFNQLT